MKLLRKPSYANAGNIRIRKSALHSFLGTVLCWGICLGALAGEPVAKTTAAQKPPVTKVEMHEVIGYNTKIKAEDFAKLGKDVVKKMQMQLESIYKELPDWKYDYALPHEPLNDGFVGPITLRWLQRFGFNFKIVTEAGYARKFPANVERIIAFGKNNPRELAMLLSAEFENWDNSQADALRKQDFIDRAQGDDKALLALLSRYKPKAASKAIVLPTRRDDSAYFYYKLTQADIDLLEGKDQVVHMLTTLKDKAFDSKEALKVAVTHALGEREHLQKQVWPLIDKQDLVFYGFLISEKALAKLKDPTLLEGLRPYLNSYFKNEELFDAFLTEKLPDFTPDEYKDEFTALKNAAKMEDNFHLSEQAIANVKKALTGNIQNAGISAAIADTLREMQDVAYPEVSVFRSAVMSRLGFGIGACEHNFPANNLYVDTLRMDDEKYALLKSDLKALHPGLAENKEDWGLNLDSELIELDKLRARTDICSRADYELSKNIIQKIYATFLSNVVESSARKKVPDVIDPISIKASDCACANEQENGTVIGFYPFWDNKKVAQAMNFGVLNRLNYYGLSVDSLGDLRLGASPFEVDDGSHKFNELIQTTRLYNAKVDWMIQKNDWGGDWENSSVDKKKAVFRKLLNNLIRLLHTPLTDFSSRLRPISTFGLEKRATRGDGVSLYFPNYPQDETSLQLFNDFYLSLRKELAKEKLWLNLVIPQSVLTAAKSNRYDAFGLNNVIKLYTDQTMAGSIEKSEVKIEEHVLVLLNEPTSDAKMRLRTDIEAIPSLLGTARAHFLRSILPVVSFDSRNWQQLDDDIAYFRNNFAGIGFWAPSFDNMAKKIEDPELSCLESKNIANCLFRHAQDASGVQLKPPSAIEKFVCANRYLLQIGLFLSLIFGAVVAFLFWKFCHIQNFIKKYILIALPTLIAPPVLLFALLLRFDPFYERLSKGNGPLVILFIIFVAVLFYVYRYVQSQKQKPQRAQATPQRQTMGFPLIVWSIENTNGGYQWIIKNQGTGYAIIKAIEISLNGVIVADQKAALDVVLGANKKLQWKSLPLIGLKLLPKEKAVGLSVTEPLAAREFKKKLRKYKPEVKITFSAGGNSLWQTDGNEIREL